MKAKYYSIIFVTLLASLLLAACKAQSAVVKPVAAQTIATPEVIKSTPTQNISEVFVPAATQIPEESTEQSHGNAAEEAAAAYFTAVSEGSTEEASELLSSFGLMVFQMTRGDAASKLLAERISGVRWSDFEILESKAMDDQTTLVHVTYMETKKETGTKTATPVSTPTGTETAPTETQKDELWPMRLENGEWRYNWNNLIDFHSLGAGAQTVGGVTVMPVQMNRYSDRIELSLLVQNRTNEGVVFGQVNETLGTFYFDGQPVVAEKTRWILNPNRSVPSATLEAKGLYTKFPEMIEIRKWKSYQVDPWYVFQLQ